MEKSKNIEQIKGMTMIEIVVVLVILAILAALTVPSLTGFIDSAHAKDCASRCTNIKKNYTEKLVDKGVQYPLKAADVNIMMDVVLNSGGAVVYDEEDSVALPEGYATRTDLNYEDYYYIFTGLCPGGGHYSVKFIGPNNVTGDSNLLLACSVPGHTEDLAVPTPTPVPSVSPTPIPTGPVPEETLQKAIEKLASDLYDKTSKAHEYYKAERDKNNSALDATGPNFGQVITKNRLLPILNIDEETFYNNFTWLILPNTNANGDFSGKINITGTGGQTGEQTNGKAYGYTIMWINQGILDYDTETRYPVTVYTIDTDGKIKKTTYGTAQLQTKTETNSSTNKKENYPAINPATYIKNQ